MGLDSGVPDIFISQTAPFACCPQSSKSKNCPFRDQLVATFASVDCSKSLSSPVPDAFFSKRSIPPVCCRFEPKTIFVPSGDQTGVPSPFGSNVNRDDVPRLKS